MKCWPAALVALALQAWLAVANEAVRQRAVKARTAKKDELDAALPDDQETLLAERDDLKAQLATKNQEFLVQHRRAHQLSIKVSALEKKLEAESKKEHALREKLGKVRSLLDDDSDGPGDSIDEDSHAPALPAPAHVHLDHAEADSPTEAVATKAKGKRSASGQRKQPPMPTALASSAAHTRKDVSFVERGSTNPAIMWPKRLGQGRLYSNNPPGEPSGAPMPGEPSGRWRTAQQPKAQQAAPAEEVHSKKAVAKHGKAAHSVTAHAQAHAQHAQRIASKAKAPKAPRAEKLEDKVTETLASGGSLPDSAPEEAAEEKVETDKAGSSSGLSVPERSSGFDEMENDLQDEDHRIEELEKDNQDGGDDETDATSGVGAELGEAAS